MASARPMWGIEVGQCALKAVKLRATDDGKVELLAFDLIEHPKLLSQPDADPDELIRAAIEKFVSRNQVQGDKFVIGVPGQQTFSRFCKLPPVDEKKIPDIVRFEASQQIPFDMADVVWDYEVFKTPDMPEVEVGIFAMRKDLIRKHLDNYAAFGITPAAIQPMPIALYNFCRYDDPTKLESATATVVVDVGAEHTDLVVVEPNSAWTRNIPLGGNAFTDALVKAFKLGFAKAENVKRTAASNPSARQIFQKMRPVFADLVAEIQRSLGFYGSTHREVQLKHVLAAGNAFRLPGLQKYLENNLTIGGGVHKLEKFHMMVPTATSNAPQFSENVLSFAGAYGLALQGLGLAVIESNLLPPELARVASWHRKRPYFAAAAACLGLAAAFPWLRNSADAAMLSNRGEAADITRIVNQAKANQKAFQEASTDTGAQEERIKKLFELQQQRALVPAIIALIHQAKPEVDPQIAAADTPEALKKLVQSDPARFARTKRRQLVIESLTLEYVPEIEKFKRPALAVSASSGAAVASISPLAGGTSRGLNPRGRGGEAGFRPSKEEEGGGGEESQESGGAAAGSDPGFMVTLSGYVMFGEAGNEVVGFLDNEFKARLLELGALPGRGFHIPAQDPSSSDRDKRNVLSAVEKRFATGAGGFAAVAARATGASGASGAGGEPEGPQALFPDPVTGEEMATDWQFSVSFKVKLGEPPAPAAPESKP